MWSDLETLLSQPGIPSLMTLTSLYLSPPIIMHGTPLALRPLYQLYPKLVVDQNIGFPIMPMFFVLFVITHGLGLGAFIIYLLDIFGSPYLVIFLTILYIAKFTSVFIVGLLTAELKKMTKEKAMVLKTSSWLQAGCHILEEYRAIKKLLSPILFLTILSESMIAVSFAYQAVAKWDVTYSLATINSLMLLGYICLAAEDCYNTIMSIPDKIW